MATTATSRPATSRVRWTVCALLFFATTINYVDRQVLSILAKTLEVQIGWDSIQYGYITAAFQAAYAIGLLGAGRVMDRIGTRKGFAIAITVWSLAAIGHAFAASAFAFGVARAFLGFGEAANFPACIKTVAEWFPKTGARPCHRHLQFRREYRRGDRAAGRALDGRRWGWQSAFIATGALGFVWLIFWLKVYHKPEEHPAISAGELALIQSDPPDRLSSYPWAPLLPKRETWAFAIGKGADRSGLVVLPVLAARSTCQETFGLSLFQAIVPLLVLYNLTTIGSIGGGWLSSTLIDRGWTVNRARKTAMFICALGVVPVIYAPYCKNLWVVVALVGTALAAHQGWSANLFTTTSDMFPRSAVGSVVGIGGTMGAAASVLHPDRDRVHRRADP